MNSLVDMGVLTQEEVEDSISITFNPVSVNRASQLQYILSSVLNHFSLSRVEVARALETCPEEKLASASCALAIWSFAD